MSSKLIFIFVALIVCCANADSGKCPSEPPARRNLEISRYVGTWYLLLTGRAWHGENDNKDCIGESYFSKPENPFLLDVAWRGRFDGSEWRMSDGLIALDSSANQWDFYMDGALFHSTIVATDYTNWAIEYSCIESAGQMKENYMIRSRRTSLPVDTLNTLKSVLEGFGVNPAEFVTISHANC